MNPNPLNAFLYCITFAPDEFEKIFHVQGSLAEKAALGMRGNGFLGRGERANGPAPLAMLGSGTKDLGAHFVALLLARCQFTLVGAKGLPSASLGVNFSSFRYRKTKQWLAMSESRACGASRMVGAKGLEPSASRSRTVRSTN